MDDRNAAQVAPAGKTPSPGAADASGSAIRF